MTILVKAAMEMFALPDLQGALADFLMRFNDNGTLVVGGRRVANVNTSLPFDDIQIWTKLQIQNKAYYAPHHVLSPQTVNASPPLTPWMFGHSDVTLINIDPSQVWPWSGLNGTTFILFNISIILTIH